MPGTEDAERALELADEAFGRLDVDAVVAHLSTAIREFTTAGDNCRAAMACVRLGDTFATAIGNLTAGRAWFARARRLVEDEPPCLEQGWVAVAAMGCDVDDPDVLLAAAELALDRARRFADVNLETKALADAGLAHVQAGRIAEGMALLDEAMALACGPADDVNAAAKSVCSFFTACYFSADFGRASSWADVLRRHGLIGSTPGGPMFLSNHCDSVHATLLMELGRWADAEAVLLRATAAFESAMSMPSWHSAIALADLRIRQGRFAEAEALLLGKDQSIQALLPAARLHLARGEHSLAGATVRRGLRAIGDDRPRAVELLAVLVDAELARGDLDAAAAACADMTSRASELDVPLLDARVATARAHVQAARGDITGAIATLEVALDRVDVQQLPWPRVQLLRELAEVRRRDGDDAGAALDAKAAAATAAMLDVVLPQEHQEHAPATLTPKGRWWEVTASGTSVRLQDTKGLRYLAELVARPGVERHALDLVDRVEGVSAEGIDRRSLGDAGDVLDARARATYRRRIEELRAEADDALAAGLLETAEAREEELGHLVTQLAQAFGLGGRDRRSASVAERARLNVTRALRAAIAKVSDAHPEAGAALDRGVQTGTYCVYRPGDTDLRWIVQS